MKKLDNIYVPILTIIIHIMRIIIKSHGDEYCDVMILNDWRWCRGALKNKPYNIIIYHRYSVLMFYIGTSIRNITH